MNQRQARGKGRSIQLPTNISEKKTANSNVGNSKSALSPIGSPDAGILVSGSVVGSWVTWRPPEAGLERVLV